MVGNSGRASLPEGGSDSDSRHDNYFYSDVASSLPPDVRGFGFPTLSLKWSTKRGHYMTVKRSDLQDRPTNGSGIRSRESRQKRKRNASFSRPEALPCSAITLSSTKTTISFTTRRLMSLAYNHNEARANVARLSYACVYELLAIISRQVNVCSVCFGLALF